MWKDANGNIVTKKPTLPGDIQKPLLAPLSHDQSLQSLQNFTNILHQENGAPISPPTSNNSSNSQSWNDHELGLASGYSEILEPNTLSSANSYSPIDERFWSTELPQPQGDHFTSAILDDAPFDEIFNPDTASSFNNPFTTMSNYNWLFELDLSRPDPTQHPSIQDDFPALDFNNHAVPQPNHLFEMQVGSMDIEKSVSTTEQLASLCQTTSSPHPPSTLSRISPSIANETIGIVQATTRSPQSTQTSSKLPTKSITYTAVGSSCADVERPMSMLQPSKSLPIIDELARAQVLDLIDITQPTAPDGSIVMRDHPLLSLSSMQTYCDLFFTRFNTVYPLIHMSTFDPSEVDTLLLTSVLLLGATYGEKDAHQLAVGHW